MSVSEEILRAMENSSWIRKMFEEGARLKKKFGAENVYDFSLGNPDVAPPAEFHRRLSVLAEEDRQGVHGYMPNSGFSDVRKDVAARISRDHGITAGEDSVVMSCGASGALNVIFKTILNPGDEVIVPSPFFVEYRFYVANHGGNLVTVATDENFGLSLDAIKEAVTEKTRAILINSPHNPTGRVYTKEEISNLAAYVDELNENGQVVYLVSDEPYRHIVYDDNVVPPVLGTCQRSMVATSFSKSLSIPGERIGYIGVNPQCPDYETLMAGLNLSTRILGFVNAPALMQRVVSGLLDESVQVDVYDRRRKILSAALAEAGYEFSKPEGAFYLFVKSPVPDDTKFVAHLQKYNILTVPGSGFGGPGYFRVSYCVPDSVIEGAIPGFIRAIEEAGSIA